MGNNTQKNIEALTTAAGTGNIKEVKRLVRKVKVKASARNKV